MYKIKKTDKSKKSEVEIEAEIAYDKVASLRSQALALIQKGLKLDGFREGHVPESIIVSKVGEMAIMEEATELALQEIVPKIVEEEKYDFLGNPQVSITKITANQPVEIKIRLVLMPTVKLADYQKIAKDINGKRPKTFDVTEKEIDETIEKVRENYAKQNHTHKEGEEHKEDEKLELPEVTEEFIKKLGDFKDLADFRVKIKDGMSKEKEYREKEKNRLEIVEKIIEKSEIELPEILIEVELNKMEAQFRDDIGRFGLKTEDYLEHLKKTMEDLRKDWRTDAEKRAKLQIVMNKIAGAEKIEPEAEKMEAEVKHLLASYKEAKEERVREYVAMVLTNELVFEFLEKIQ